MSHPRQDEARRLGQNDEPEVAKKPETLRHSPSSDEKGNESKEGESDGHEAVQNHE